MEKMKFTELLLQEAYKVDNADDFIEAIKSNSFGVKIPKFVKELANEEDNSSFKGNVETILDEISRNGIKKVQGLQALLCIVSPDFSFSYIADKIQYRDDTADEDGIDALMLVLKYWNADWMSLPPEGENVYDKTPIKDRILEGKDKDRLDTSFFADLADDLYDAVYSHGSNSKGVGNWKDVVMLYPRRVNGWNEKINPYESDENGWQLFVPQSFDGERAIAWYGTNPKDMQPTHWCTRARIGYYRNYTRGEDGSNTVLYVIRNLKTGHAWQCAIQTDAFDFLNEMDKPDRYTEGDLDIFPDKLLKLVEDDFVSEYGFPMNARSLYDYKQYQNSLEDDPEYEDDESLIKEPFVLNDRNCKVKPILGEPIQFNADDFGIQQTAKDYYKIRICPILNGVQDTEPNNGSDLTMSEFFEHDYEYGYENRASDDDENAPLYKMHNYGRKRGKFWRIIMEENGETYHHDIGLCDGQHVYGGIVKDSDPSNWHSDYNDTMAGNFEAIEKKMLGTGKSHERFSSAINTEKSLKETFEKSIKDYYDSKAPEVNMFLKQHSATINNKEYYPMIKFDSNTSVPILYTNSSGGFKIRDIEYPTEITADIVCKNDLTVSDGIIRFDRKLDDGSIKYNLGKEVLTDVDTLVAEEYVAYQARAFLDKDATKKLYNFMLGIYAITRKVVGSYVVNESMFEEIYNLSKIN